MIHSACRMLLRKSAASSFAGAELYFSQPAATAASGFRSITQKTIRPPFTRVNTDASHEISGGDVKAITVSCGRVSIKRSTAATEKQAKFSVPRQRLVLP